MELEKYTERAKGFLQSAQALALRSGHQRLTPEHLLQVLLDDPEGLAANLIAAAGGDAKQALAGVEAELGQAAQGRGRAAPARSTWRPRLARLFEQAEQLAQKAGDSLRHGRAAAARAGAGQGHRRRQGAERRRRHAGER